MFRIEMAGLVIRIENRFDYVRDLCRDYLTEQDRPADLVVSVLEEELRREVESKRRSFQGSGHERSAGTGSECETAFIYEDGCGDEYSPGYVESLEIYKKISAALPAFDAFVMHSSVVAVDGQAYCFAAESGTGKSTHTRYWKDVLGERVTIINGDKPVYRFDGGEYDCRRLRKAGRSGEASMRAESLVAYGTPWCGKENWQTNMSAPLRALCMLERGDENTIVPADAFEMLAEMMHYFYLPGNDLVDMGKMMELIDRLLAAVPVYRLRCRNDVSAAETAAAYFGL